MLIYRRSDQLQLIGYTDSDFDGCIDSKKSTSGYVLLMASERFPRKVSNRYLLPHLQWRQSSLLVMKLRTKLYGSGILFMDSVGGFSQKELYCDNRATELYYKRDKSSVKSRHINIKFLSLKIEFEKYCVC